MLQKLGAGPVPGHRARMAASFSSGDYIMGRCHVLAHSTSPTIRALECNVEGTDQLVEDCGQAG